MAENMTDPFRVIETAKPAFSESEAMAIAHDRYGIVANATELVSERDQNFRLRAQDGTQYVLKFANPAEALRVSEQQVQALLHLQAYLEAHASPLHAPQVRRTLDGETSFGHTWDGEPITVRLVTFVPGLPVRDPASSPALCRNLGVCLAELDRALAGFSLPGGDQHLLWDIKEALRLRELLPHVPAPEARDRLERTLDEFEHIVLPSFAGLRWQTIHNDLNPDNVLVDPGDGDRVVGVIDFGDMCRSPLIVDVAVAASYLRKTEADPLAAIAEFVAGYAAVSPLRREETDVLLDLIRARLATTISILYWRHSLRPLDDPYLQSSATDGSAAEAFLERLSGIPREHAQRVFRQICAGTNRDRKD